MKLRLLAALAAALVLTSAADPADGKKLTLRWHGQSFFDLETSQGTRIAFDPHLIDAYGRVPVKADLVCISHLHDDHTQVSAIDNPKVKVLVGLKQNGKRLDWNPIDEKFRDVHIQTVGVYHDNMHGLERGKNSVFIIEVDGLRIVHLGDLGHVLTEEQLNEIRPVDVLLIPVGGVYTLNGADAKKVIEQLKPKRYVVPMHYGTKVYDDLLPVDEFLEDQDPANVRKLENTNKLEIDTTFQPKAPVTVILGWK